MFIIQTPNTDLRCVESPTGSEERSPSLGTKDCLNHKIVQSIKTAWLAKPGVWKDVDCYLKNIAQSYAKAEMIRSELSANKRSNDEL